MIDAVRIEQLTEAVAFRNEDLAAFVAAAAAKVSSPRLQATTTMLERYAPLAAESEEFWRAPRNREAAAWPAHREINDVTLAAAFAPHGSIELPPPPGRPAAP